MESKSSDDWLSDSWIFWIKIDSSVAERSTKIQEYNNIYHIEWYYHTSWSEESMSFVFLLSLRDMVNRASILAQFLAISICDENKGFEMLISFLPFLWISIDLPLFWYTQWGSLGKGSKDNAASRHRKITVWTMWYPQAIINQIE